MKKITTAIKLLRSLRSDEERLLRSLLRSSKDGSTAYPKRSVIRFTGSHLDLALVREFLHKRSLIRTQDERQQIEVSISLETLARDMKRNK